MSAPRGESNPYGSAGKKNPRSGRLLRHADFERVYKQGRRHFAAHMTVFYLRREEGDGMRVGFTVGRVLGDAVDRNRMKRRLRESVRLSRPAASPPVDVVINPKKSVRTVEFSILRGEISKAFEVIAQKMRGA
ncbi:MAG TPA: ribonuclease P protein component [Terriglobales bacterium]|nr:ribonuclease P protein component [Terriglobales bacterium]